MLKEKGSTLLIIFNVNKNNTPIELIRNEGFDVQRVCPPLCPCSSCGHIQQFTFNTNIKMIKSFQFNARA